MSRDDSPNEAMSASDVKAGNSEISFGEFRRLEGLTAAAQEFIEKNAALPDNYSVVITNGVFSLRPPR